MKIITCKINKRGELLFRIHNPRIPILFTFLLRTLKVEKWTTLLSIRSWVCLWQPRGHWQLTFLIQREVMSKSKNTNLQKIFLSRPLIRLNKLRILKSLSSKIRYKMCPKNLMLHIMLDSANIGNNNRDYELLSLSVLYIFFHDH